MMLTGLSISFFVKILVVFTVCSVLLRFFIFGHLKKVRWLMIVTRLCSAGLLLFLFQKILLKAEDVVAPSEEKQEIEKIIVLTDVSNSMTFKERGEMTRADLAQKVLNQVEEKKKGLKFIEVESRFFADKTVAAENSNTLSLFESKLHGSFFNVLQRERPNKLLILSDGAATDSPMSSIHSQWARNYGIEVYRVLTADMSKPKFDLVCYNAKAKIKNPTAVECDVQCLGKLDEQVHVQLYVDGEKAGDKTLLVKGMEHISFRLDPELEPGWHDFKMVVGTLAGEEVTLRNNSCRGIFYKAALDKTKIIFIYDKARLENRMIQKAFKLNYEEEFNAFHYEDSELAALDWRTVKLLIIADVAPKDFPVALNPVFSEEKTCVLFLASEHLRKWSERGELPVKVGRMQALAHEESLGVQVSDLSTIKLNPEMKVHRYYEVGDTQEMLTLIAAQKEKKTTPVLMADREIGPSRLLLLVDDSWRWSRSLHEDVRLSFQHLQDYLVSLSYPEMSYEGKIYLTMKKKDDSNEVLLEAGALYRKYPFSSLNLRVSRNGKDEVVKMKKFKGDRFRLIYEYDTEPGIIWFEALGDLAGEEEASAKLPLLVENTNIELHSTLPRLEALEKISTKSEFSAVYGSHESLLDELLKEPEKVVVKGKHNQRDHFLELLVTILIISLWLIEIFVERKFIQEMD